MTDLLSTKKIYGKTLLELGEKNEDVFVVEADLMKASGSGPFKDKFPERYINVGIAEQNLVGTASGLAAMGEVPFASTFANFMSQRACDQVVISVAYNKFNAKLVGSYAGLSSEKNGGTHISVLDLAIMRCIPNMAVLAPGDVYELSDALKAAYFYEGPVYIRMPRSLPENILPKADNFEIGEAYQYGNGNDLTIASTGLATHIALEAKSELGKKD
jgi:transketolase